MLKSSFDEFFFLHFLSLLLVINFIGMTQLETVLLNQDSNYPVYTGATGRYINLWMCMVFSLLFSEDLSYCILGFPSRDIPSAPYLSCTFCSIIFRAPHIFCLTEEINCCQETLWLTYDLGCYSILCFQNDLCNDLSVSKILWHKRLEPQFPDF